MFMVLCTYLSLNLMLSVSYVIWCHLCSVVWTSVSGRSCLFLKGLLLSSFWVSHIFFSPSNRVVDVRLWSALYAVSWKWSQAHGVILTHTSHFWFECFIYTISEFVVVLWISYIEDCFRSTMFKNVPNNMSADCLGSGFRVFHHFDRIVWSKQSCRQFSELLFFPFHNWLVLCNHCHQLRVLLVFIGISLIHWFTCFQCNIHIPLWSQTQINCEWNNFDETMYPCYPIYLWLIEMKSEIFP